MAGERILIADDEPDVREMCVRTLRRAGYNVVGVGSGQEAIERVQQEHFDLLLTDLKMPQMGGLEAYRTIHASNPDLMAVVMTGFGTMEAAIDALRLGVSEFVLKPFRTAELVEAIERALSRRRMQRENARLKALIPLFELSHAFMSSVDLAVIPQHVVRIAQHELRADNASLMLLNYQGELTIHSATGLSEQVVATTRQKADQGIAGYAITHRETVILQGDPRNDPRFGEMQSSEQVRSAICLPLIHQDKVLGVLNVSRIAQPVPFTEGDAELLAVLGSQAAIAIDNARLFQEIQTAYKKLAELDHLKSEFISIAAHELRSPLAVVLTYAALLEAEATGQMRQHLGQVTQAGMQLKSIIDEMISLREIDTGEAQVTISNVIIAETVTGVLEDLGLLASRKHQQVQVQIPPDLPPARGDPRLVFLILSNLLSNAIKFTPEQGSITVTARSDEGRVVVAIHDTGVGIPEAELERIFQRFYQVEDSLRRKHGGIGLGLAIAREMADLIGAKIEVVSKEGEGSVFSLILPQA